MLRRILLALDYSDSGQVAVSFAVSLAAPGAEVRVVHVNEYVVGGHGLTIETAQEAARLADDAVSRLVSCGVQASACVRNTACFGVAELIVTAADSWAAEAIVLGSHRYRGLRRLRG